MYRDHDDPWLQSKEGRASDKAVVLHLMRKMGVQRVIELGCGLGHFTTKIAEIDGLSVLGVDTSPTAIEKARVRCPRARFQVADILDYNVYREFRPDMIVMAEITWYVLDKLDRFIEFLRTEHRDAYLIHLLVTYPPGVQKIGADRFTTLAGIMKYFGMDYLEWGELREADNYTTKTFFLGRWPAHEAVTGQTTS